MADILTPIGKVTITPRGEYDSGATYERLDLVTEFGSSFLYINLTPSAGSSLDNTEFWQVIAHHGDAISQSLVNEATNARDQSQSARDTAIAQAALAQGYAAQLAAGTASPAGTYANLAALNDGTPTAPNTSKIYITLNDGKWCYHNGSAWVAGGVYQAASISTMLDDVSTGQLIDVDTITVLNLGPGSWKLSQSNNYESFSIPADPNTYYTIQNTSTSQRFHVIPLNQSPALNVPYTVMPVTEPIAIPVTILTGTDTTHLFVYYWNKAVDPALSRAQILPFIKVEKGTVATPDFNYTKSVVKELYLAPDTQLKINSTAGLAHASYGVKWDTADNDDRGQRCFSAVGKVALPGIGDVDGMSDFDTIYPWSKIKRCNILINANGAAVVTFEGDTGFSLDGTNGDVFVRIPKFTVDRYTEDGYEYRIIGSPTAPVHEAFVEDGKILDEIFIGAFEGYIDGDGSMRSIGSILPTSNKTPPEFLAAAVENGTNYSLYDSRCVDAIWTLMAVEYGKRNSNQVIGYGWADFLQPDADARQIVAFAATGTNSVKVPVFNAATKARMPVGSYITICDTVQTNIIAQRLITDVEDTDDNAYTQFTFDGDPVNVTTSCFIGGAACETNFCETSVAPLTWHTGRANFDTVSPTKRNPIRYRWIENIVGSLWHYLPDISFNALQMYFCNNMLSYEFHKITGDYKPVGSIFIENNDNSSKTDLPTYNYWVDSLANDQFAKCVTFGKTYDKSLVSTQAFGAYYYVGSTLVCIANGGGFDHDFRCNMLTNRAWIPVGNKWHLYGARLIYKHLQ